MHGQVVGIPREELKDLLQRGDQVRPVNHVKCLRQVQSETDASLQLGLADAQLQLSSGAAVPLACSSNVGDVLYGSPQGIREPAMGLIRKLGDVP